MPVKPSKVGCLGTLSLSLGWGGLATPQGMSRWPRLNRGIAEIGLSAKGTAARFWGPFHNADSLVLSPCRARGEPRLVSKREFSAGRREQSLHIGWTKGWNVRGIATESGGKSAAEPNRGGSSSLTSESLEALADLRDPQSWYPTARRMKRRWILHVGPTNSYVSPSAPATMRLAPAPSMGHALVAPSTTVKCQAAPPHVPHSVILLLVTPLQPHQKPFSLSEQRQDVQCFAATLGEQERVLLRPAQAPCLGGSRQDVRRSDWWQQD
jgi:hypothetical protein